MRTPFRLDICDPLIPATGKEPLVFSFEEILIEDNAIGEVVTVELAFASGYSPWIHKGLISEDGLRVLARAALATAEQLRETKERRNRKR